MSELSFDVVGGAYADDRGFLLVALTHSFLFFVQVFILRAKILDLQQQIIDSSIKLTINLLTNQRR